jgi:aryl-alcohol dehydrogenase-like predicted oxidoreductase
VAGPCGDRSHLNERDLGSTGLKVSAVSVGTAELGLDYGIPVDGLHRRPSKREGIRFIRRAIERGVTLFDTAPAYGDSESILGLALRGTRSGISIATKVSVPPRTHEPDVRQLIQSSVVSSLRALRTDVIDIVQLHSADAETLRQGEALAALQELRTAGQIRLIGATTYGLNAARAALEDRRLQVLQLAVSPLDRVAETQGILQLGKARRVGVIARSVLLRGVLTERRRHLPPELRGLTKAVTRLADIAVGSGVELPVLAYRYVLSLPGVSSALVGTVRMSELDLVLRAAETGPLDDSVVQEIRSIHLDDLQELDPRTWPPDHAWWSK